MPEPIHPAQQHPRDVQRHVALADDHRVLPAQEEVRVHGPPVLRVPVVPPDKVPRGAHPAQRVLAGDAEPPVARGAIRQDQPVVVRDDARERQVVLVLVLVLGVVSVPIMSVPIISVPITVPDGHVPQVPKVRVLRHLGEPVLAVLYRHSSHSNINNTNTTPG